MGIWGGEGRRRFEVGGVTPQPKRQRRNLSIYLDLTHPALKLPQINGRRQVGIAPAMLCAIKQSQQLNEKIDKHGLLQ
jgi:hypothetical protein